MQGDMNDKRLEMLLRLASERLGVGEDELAERLERGDIGSLGQHMRPEQQQQLGGVLSNPEAMKQLMDSPAARALLRSLMGGA